MAEKTNFRSLDALRGIAALSVLLLHMGQTVNFPMVPSAYLAVDVFFVLSGFVIAYAYEARLEQNLTTARFMRLRLARFFPLYALGSLIGAAVAMIGIVTRQSPDILIEDIARAMGWAALFLPTPRSSLIDTLYPLNPPAWSLFFELAINALYALIFLSRRPSTKLMTIVVIISGLALCGAIAYSGSGNLGHRWSTVYGGILRVTFSFFLGALIFRYRPDRRLDSRLLFLAAPALLALLFCFDGERWRPEFDIVFVVFLSPAIVLMTFIFEVPSKWEAITRFLGVASFIVYALHKPLLVMSKGAATIIGLNPVVGCGLAIGILLVSCPLIDAYYDRPLRKWFQAAGRANATA
jgi:peptidoglycan/LPS O-acetylase OafA/YrhL